AAILAADVAGYSRLMGEDEPATIATITDYRNIFRDQIEANGGRVVDMAGDSILAVFDSAAGAVAAAVATQTALGERNAGLDPLRQMHFRIGVNLGDIREAGDGTVYGDGVNVAARLEGLAEPGGVMISEFAYQQVRRNPEMAFADAGRHEVKNIADPVRAYRVLAPGAAAQEAPRRRAVALSALAMAVIVLAGIAFWQTQRPPAVETASLERMAHPLPDEPSIAVLPFDNLSAGEEHDFIADGLSENIISALSQTRGMLVIARNSTFTYKGEAVKVQEVAEALGVRYVLEGSIQVVGERLRATAQLIDALSGNHLWSERYDHALDDVFAVQDDITLNVVSALQVQLTEGPHALVWRGGTKSLEAWSLFQRGREHLLRFTSDGVAEARRLFEQAVAIDPTFALALAQIGNTHRLEVRMGFSPNPEKSLDDALSYAEQAVAIDHDSPDAHAVLAMVFHNRHDFARAIEQVEIALRLGPNHGYVLGIAAVVLSPLGHTERAIALLEQAMRLSPNHLNWYPLVVAESHLLAGRHQMALDALEAAKADIVPQWRAWIRVAALGGLGRDDEARRAVAERLEDEPGFSIASHRERLEGPGAYAPETVATYVSLLRAAGVPEHAPGAVPDRPVIAVLPFGALSDDPE
ncbi:MAG: adenylate/guanylate cyclase domain-containing protein, partial [Alphaproteobacteria bacterium]|nr:adenylate/guanylate cyclase domain-containing protein [Alphaproteobacteria bacterium]